MSNTPEIEPADISKAFFCDEVGLLPTSAMARRTSSLPRDLDINERVTIRVEKAIKDKTEDKIIAVASSGSRFVVDAIVGLCDHK